jgi:hypothetical protein
MTRTITTEPGNEQATEIRSFRIDVPEAELVDLRKRVNATRWPDRETVPDQTQGVQLATVQALAKYWATSTTGASVKPG